MARKRNRKLNSQKSVDVSRTDGIKVEIEMTVDKTKYDDANQLILLPGTSKKLKTQSVEKIVPKVVPLSKKKRKKLEKILERKKKIKDRKLLINELKKYEVSGDEYAKMTSIDKLQTKGLKRFFNEKEENVSFDRGNKSLKATSKCTRKNNLSSVDVHSSNLNVVAFGESSDEEEEEEVHDVENVNENPEPLKEETVQDISSEQKQIVMKNDVKVLLEKEVSNDNVKNENVIEDVSNEITEFMQVNRSEEIQKARLLLPITAEEQVIMEAIRYNPIVIICGETGSGKTTQLPQFLYEAGYAKSQKICVTEPRRVAAISMSKRVAFEMNMSTKEISYHIRFDRTISPETKICFMTDGVLMREIQKDFLLSSYSVVIIDEAHERSLHSDILIGLLSRIVPLRYKKGSPLRLVIMSATLRVEDFTSNTRLFKVEPKVLKVSSRQFSVTTHFSKRTPEDYVQEAYLKVCSIHRKYPDGGILVFVTGQQEVNSICAKLRRTFPSHKQCDGGKTESFANDKVSSKKKRKIKFLDDLMPSISLENYKQLPEDEDLSDEELEDVELNDEIHEDLITADSCSKPIYCLPLYSKLPEEKQTLIFEPPPDGSRLCVVATNVAETSITIPNIKYVVDTGKVKVKVFDKITGISTMVITWTSKASADQRAGRAGRMSHGHCFRLYSSAIFNDQFPQFSEPEICKKPVDELFLQMKSMNIDNILNFPFPTSPSAESLKASEKRLISLGALEETVREKNSQKNYHSKITELGNIMSFFPLNPRYSKMLALAVDQGLLEFTIAIISALTVQHIFLDDNFGNEEVENTTRETWKSLRRRWLGNDNSLLLGDMMVMLKAVGAAEYVKFAPRLLQKYGLRHKAMIEIHKLREQLTSSVNKIVVNSEVSLEMQPPTNSQAKCLRQLMLTGLFDHVARKIPEHELPDSHKQFRNCYKSIETETIVHLPSQSALADHKPELVVYQEIYESSKLYMRNVVAIESEWLPIYAPHLCKFSKPLEKPEPRYDKLTDRVMCHITGTFGPYSWQLPKTEIEFPLCVEKYRWFARFLLEGEVIPFFAQYKSVLLSSPSIMVKSWANLQPRTESLLSALCSHKCATKECFLSLLRKESSFCCNEYCQWIPNEVASEVRLKWSSMLSSDS